MRWYNRRRLDRRTRRGGRRQNRKDGHQPRPQGGRRQACRRAQGGAGRQLGRARLDARRCRRHAEGADRNARQERAAMALRQAAAPAHHRRSRARRAQPQEPEISVDYDLFTIGGGSGGVRASRVSASYGAKVAIAESHLFGGTCVNVGCIPKKLFSYAAHWREEFEIAQAYGWTTEAPRFDWPTLLANKDKEIARLNAIYERVLSVAGVEIMRGRATVLSPHEVEMGAKRYTAKHILIATGSWPVIPPIPGREHAITSNEVQREPRPRGARREAGSRWGRPGRPVFKKQRRFDPCHRRRHQPHQPHAGGDRRGDVACAHAVPRRSDADRPRERAHGGVRASEHRDRGTERGEGARALRRGRHLQAAVPAAQAHDDREE